MAEPFRQRIRGELSGPAVPLMAFGVALNLTVGQITAALKLPVYLDSIGTVLTAVLCGPWAAAVAGTLANVLAAAFGSPSMAFFIPVVLVIAAFTAFVARLGWFRRWYLVLLGGAIQGVLAAVVSAPIASFVFGGTMMAGTDLLVIFYRSLGNDLFRSTLLQGLTSDPVDKALTYTLVFLLVRNLPTRILGRFRGAAALSGDS
jgi:energy-coupling factor transport system substrate-specific component